MLTKLGLLRFLFTICLSLCLTISISADDTITIEEQRIGQAKLSMPEVFEKIGKFLDGATSACLDQSSYKSLEICISSLGDRLWLSAKNQAHATMDDRYLYWARLELSQFIRKSQFIFSLNVAQRLALIEKLERHSRGRNDLKFDEAASIHILLTGFDPFLLDRHIDQSNPSGIAALTFDNQFIRFEEKQAQIQTALFPVRYADFDEGELEDLLAPYYKDNSVDMIITLSMGRDEFDLEHFPGRRRSSLAPDNLNVFSGGDEKNPVIPKLLEKDLEGEEFYEFSLPFQAIQRAEKGASYKINDRRQVTTLDATLTVDNIVELENAIAVRGGGGGYLSNEISYRSLRLANHYGSTIPTGHIHTPRIASFDIKAIKKIITQLESMLIHSLPAL